MENNLTRHKANNQCEGRVGLPGPTVARQENVDRSKIMGDKDEGVLNSKPAKAINEKAHTQADLILQAKNKPS